MNDDQEQILESAPKKLLESRLSDGDIVGAVGLCISVLKQSPNDAFFLESLADIYAIIGAFESSAVLYKAVLDRSFDTARLDGKLREVISARKQRTWAAADTAVAKTATETLRGSIDNVTFPSWTSRFMRYDTDSGKAAWGIAVVDGWAIADSGVSGVEFFVDGTPAGAAPCAYNRPDVQKAFPGVSESLKSGFRIRIDTSAFRDSEHRLTLVARSRSGSMQEVSCKDIVFDNSSPCAKNLCASARTLANPSELTENGPFKLGISLSSKCNLRCVMCRPKDDDQAVKGFSAVNMPMTVFERLKPFIPRAFVIIPQGFGEPMMHPQFDEIVPSIRALNDRAVIIFTTNGTLLNERRADLLIDAHASIIEVSVDSLNPETYSYIRRGSELSRVLCNLDYLAEARAKKNAKAPIVRLKFVVMRQTVNELPSFVRYAVDHGIGHIFFNDVEPFYTSADQFTIDHNECLDHYIEAKQLASSHGIFLDGTSISTFEAARARRTMSGSGGTEEGAKTPRGAGTTNTFGSASACPDPFSTMLVETTGDVTVCCFSGGGVLGNVLKQDIEAIWNGEKYRALRSGFLGKELAKECAYCVKRNIVPEIPYEISLTK